MKINSIPTKQILDYEKEIGHELQVNVRRDPKLPKFYVKFPQCEVIEGGMLTGICGDGNTIDQAIKDYCKQISGKTITFDGLSRYRHVMTVPNLIHVKHREKAVIKRNKKRKS